VKPLIETNPHLKDPAKYRKALIAKVASSTAIETGASIESIAHKSRPVHCLYPMHGTRSDPVIWTWNAQPGYPAASPGAAMVHWSRV